MADAPELVAGNLLVATPLLDEPTFGRSVVYLIAHNEEGSLGVIINRMSDTPVDAVLPAWGDYVARPRALYMGGPVETDAALAMGVLRDANDGAEDVFQPVVGPVTLVSLAAEPAEVTPKLRGLRVFAGHSGWGVGQLEAELAEGAWTVLPGLPGDLLVGPQVDLWFQVLRRQGWPRAMEAYWTKDPVRN